MPCGPRILQDPSIQHVFTVEKLLKILVKPTSTKQEIQFIEIHRQKLLAYFSLAVKSRSLQQLILFPSKGQGCPAVSSSPLERLKQHLPSSECSQGTHQIKENVLQFAPTLTLLNLRSFPMGLSCLPANHFKMSILQICCCENK